jgi:hypothetical protein
MNAITYTKIAQNEESKQAESVATGISKAGVGQIMAT